MQEYKPRKIAYKELLEIGDWRIKVYTITKAGEFHQPAVYTQVQAELSDWLSQENSFVTGHENMGFLILHAATEGVFAIITWWVGKNMMNSHIYFTQVEGPVELQKISGDGLSPCIWEQAVINHECISWTSNVLKQESKPQYEAYLRDVYSGSV